MVVSVDIDADLLNAIDQAAGVQKISRDAAFKDALKNMGGSSAPMGTIINRLLAVGV